MQKLAVVVATLATLLVVCNATGDNAGSYGFDIDSLLECFVENPFAGVPGQPGEKLEDIPVIPFQPAQSGEVYLPVTSSFQRPAQREDVELLLRFVGAELNNQLSAIDLPTSDPPLARSIIPLRILTSSAEADTADGVPPEGPYSDMVGDIIDYLIAQGVIQETDRQLVEDIADGLTRNCTLMARWQLLPSGYWPPYYAASFCSGGGCSLPGGLTCEPVLSERTILYITVLRWDCCWSLRDLQWRWECGWRKVRIPIISQCHCGCGPLFVGDGFSYTGRIGGPFTIAVDGQNI